MIFLMSYLYLICNHFPCLYHLYSATKLHKWRYLLVLIEKVRD